MQRACDVHRFLPQSMSEVAMQSVTSEADVSALLANVCFAPERGHSEASRPMSALCHEPTFAILLSRPEHRYLFNPRPHEVDATASVLRNPSCRYSGGSGYFRSETVRREEIIEHRSHVLADYRDRSCCSHRIDCAANLGRPGKPALIARRHVVCYSRHALAPQLTRQLVKSPAARPHPWRGIFVI